MQRNHYMEIPLNNQQSSKMKDAFQNKIYDIEVAKYGQPFSYTLLLTDKGYQLISSLDGKIQEPENKSYTFVIIPDQDGNPLLRIRNGGHYFLSGKAEFVCAAGDITFKDGRIIDINDQSGAYHLNKSQMNNEQKENYQASLTRVFEAVGLPFDAYKTFEPKADEIIKQEKTSESKKPSSSCSSHMFRLFTPQRAALAATVVTAVAILAIQSI